MAKRADLTKFLDTGAQFVALTRAQARARAKGLVETGQLAQGQVQAFVDDLVDESRRRTDEMLGVVRDEIQRQMKLLGLVTKDDLARLEARVAAGTAAKPKTKPTASKPAGKKAGRKKAGRKKDAASKPAGKKSGAKRSGAKKSKQSPAGSGSGSS